MDFITKLVETERQRREQGKNCREIYAKECKKGMDIELERFDYGNWVKMHIDDIVTEKKGLDKKTYFITDGEKVQIYPYETVRVFE